MALTTVNGATAFFWEYSLRPLPRRFFAISEIGVVNCVSSGRVALNPVALGPHSPTYAGECKSNAIGGDAMAVDATEKPIL